MQRHDEGESWPVIAPFSAPPPVKGAVRRDALLSDCGTYRYWLTRTWDATQPLLCWILLNPSTADALVDDPTIRRCLGYAQQWGYGSIRVVNLFAFRATHPHTLHTAADPIGPANDATLQDAAGMAGLIIAGWGVHGQWGQRDSQVLRLLAAHDLYCLGKTGDGSPRHPLYLRSDMLPRRYHGRF